MLPPKIQTAAELAPLINRSENWIISRTGVAERRIAEEPMDVIAAKAARQALGKGARPDCILNASTTPLQIIPDSSVFIQRQLGMKGIPSWSIHGTCLSFLIALTTAASLIEAAHVKRILIVSAETGTPWRNLKEAESAALFRRRRCCGGGRTNTRRRHQCISRLGDEHLAGRRRAHRVARRRDTTSTGHPEKTKPEDNLFHMEGTRIYRMALGTRQGHPETHC